MFAVDALLGNFDRHNGNWGFLYDPKNDRREIAPVYDCGSCLLPQADDAVMRAVLTDKEALDLRIYRFPLRPLSCTAARSTIMISFQAANMRNVIRL